MDLRHFSIENHKRCTSLHGFNHPLSTWSTSDWMVAVLGEAGEAANIVKKLNRVRDGVPGNKETAQQLKEMLADEIADTFVYLDLLAQSLDLDMETLVRSKFNKVSKRIGYPFEL